MIIGNPLIFPAGNKKLTNELVLFDSGDNTDVTGGWSSSNTNTNQANIAVGEELSLSVSGAGTSYTYRSFFYANNPVDLTDITTLTANVTAAQVKANSWHFGAKEAISNLIDDFAAEVQFTAAGELSLDVSALSGEYYVGFATSFVGANLRKNTASIASVKALQSVDAEEIYEGAYTVTPSTAEQTLPTAKKTLLNDVTVKEIPFYEVSNTAGGSTVYIGSEIEFN